MFEHAIEEKIFNAKIKYYKYVKNTICKLKEINEFKKIDFEDGLIETHPLLSLLANRINNSKNLTSNEIYNLIKYISNRYTGDIELLHSDKIIGIQSNYLIPDMETRGMKLSPQSISDIETERFIFKIAKQAQEKMPSEWMSFTNIVKSYTTVEIDGKSAPQYFSGSFSEGLGSIHGAHINCSQVYVEIFTHEASHIRLFLLDWNGSQLVMNNSNAVYYSPWRHDSRPMIGVYHAYYVFANVAKALFLYNNYLISKRIMYMLVRVEDAGIQIEKFALLTDLGKEVYLITKKSLDPLFSFIDFHDYQNIKIQYLKQKDKLQN